MPYAFTENGVAKLSSVLTGEKAIQLNIQIIRAFNYLKKKYLENDEVKRNFDLLTRKIELIAQKQEQDVTFIFIELDRLDKLIESRPGKKQIGLKKIINLVPGLHLK